MTLRACILKEFRKGQTYGAQKRAGISNVLAQKDPFFFHMLFYWKEIASVFVNNVVPYFKVPKFRRAHFWTRMQILCLLCFLPYPASKISICGKGCLNKPKCFCGFNKNSAIILLIIKQTFLENKTGIFFATIVCKPIRSECPAMTLQKHKNHVRRKYRCQ